MTGHSGFWDFENSLETLSVGGDPVEKLDRAVLFEQFCPLLSKIFHRSNPSKGGPHEALQV